MIGLDTTIVKDDEGEGTIEVKGYLYELKNVVWRGDMIRGRGTACFFVRRQLRPYIVKDSWIIRGRAPTETYFLRKAMAKGVKGIPTLLASMTVRIDGNPDICSYNRGVHAELQDRVHRRYLFRECGVPITHFRSQCEFLHGFLNCLEGDVNSYMHHNYIDDQQ